MSWQKQLGSSIKELRFVFCQSSERSTGLRNHIAANYWKWKQQNPQFPFIVRECEEIDPYILIRYKYGVEKKALVANFEEGQVDELLQELVSQASKVNAQI